MLSLPPPCIALKDNARDMQLLGIHQKIGTKKYLNLKSVPRFCFLTAHMQAAEDGRQRVSEGEKQRHLHRSIPTCQIIGTVAGEPGATPARFWPCIPRQYHSIPAAHRVAFVSDPERKYTASVASHLSDIVSSRH